MPRLPAADLPPIAGTLFQGTKLALTVWFLAPI